MVAIELYSSYYLRDSLNDISDNSNGTTTSKSTKSNNNKISSQFKEERISVSVVSKGKQ